MSVRLEEEDSELDPVGLQKAFRFAAWSSVVLVRTLHLILTMS
jgi:urea-proton symporter